MNVVTNAMDSNKKTGNVLNAINKMCINEEQIRGTARAEYLELNNF